MRSLGAFSDPDGLSQLLLRLTANSTLYCLSEMTTPWGFKVARRSGPAFHLLTAGSAWLEVEGRNVAGSLPKERAVGTGTELSLTAVSKAPISNGQASRRRSRTGG